MTGLILLEFSLADELPARSVARVFTGAGLVVLAIAGASAWHATDAMMMSRLALACGPLAFLGIHRGVRGLFRRWKGGEPTLVFASGIGRAAPGRWFHEHRVPRRVSRHDYLYSWLLGLGMLLAAAPAIGAVIGAEP